MADTQETTEHRTGTREEWLAAREELAKLESEHAERNEEIIQKRRELPWVPVEKEYEFETQEGKKTLAELFEGRSQLLAYNVMYGPDYSIGACPGCTSLADELDGSSNPPGPQGRNPDLLLTRADRPAHRVQGADGLGVPLRLDLRAPTSPGTSGWR